MSEALQRPRHRFAVRDIERMLEAGLLADKRLELIDGELIEMNAQGAPHAILTAWIRRLVERTYGDGFYVRDHSPLQCSDYDLPEPDVALVRGALTKTAAEHPKGADVVLVVEVSFTTLKDDRAKAAIYARGGVPEYWIVDPTNRRIEVRRGPQPDGQYRQTLLVEADAQLPWPERTDAVAAADLLP